MMNFRYVTGVEVPITICSYAKSKSIKIYVKEGYIKITKPVWYSQKDIMKYIEENKKYINEVYQKNKEKIKKNSILFQEYLLYLGKKYNLNIIQQHDKKIAKLEIRNENINVYIPQELSSNDKEYILTKCVNGMYKNITKIFVEGFLVKYTKIMNISMPRFRIKDCKTIWGSCSSKGNLNFNLKLAMLPSEIIEQIVIHELCHLTYMNHSKEFWNLVYRYCEKERYLQGKKCLKENIYNSFD